MSPFFELEARKSRRNRINFPALSLINRETETGSQLTASTAKSTLEPAMPSRSLLMALCGGKGLSQGLGIGSDGAQQSPRGTAGLLGAPLPFLHGSDAELISCGELRLRHARGVPDCAYIDLWSHVRRGISIR